MAEILYDQTICRYVCMTYLISDRAPAFLSNVVSELSRKFGIKSERGPQTPVYYNTVCFLLYATVLYKETSYLKTRNVPRPNIHSTKYSTRPSFVFCHLRTFIGTSCFTMRCFGLWNSLPSSLRKTSTSSSFRSSLKTYIFGLTYPLRFFPRPSY